MGRQLFRLLQRLIPRSWRATVSDDLEEEAQAARRGDWWLSWQALWAGLPLRAVVVLDLFTTDVRQSVRSLLKSPGFTAAAILSFALGIGANVALLSVIDRLMFRPLPFPDPGGLVVLHNPSPIGESRSLWWIMGRALRDEARTVGGFATASGASGETMVDGFGAGGIRIGVVSDNLLSTLGVRPQAGRGFTINLESRGDEPTELLISDAVWNARFGRSPDVLESVVGSGDRLYRIVGILPPDFVNPALELSGRLDALVARRVRFDGPPRDRTRVAAFVARLSPGASIRDARAEAETIRRRVRGAFPDFFGVGQPIRVSELQAGMILPYAPFLWLILGAGSLVLLIGCANLSTLLLARGRARIHEAAIRSTLGASRGRLVVVSGMETLVLCLASGVAALLLLTAVQSSLIAIVPPAFQGFDVSAGDGRLIGLTLGLACLSAMVAGVAPSLTYTRFDPLAALRRKVSGRSGGRLSSGRALLAIEAALAIVLVAGAAGAVRSFAGLVLRDPGFEAPNLFSVDVSFDPQRRVRGAETVPARDVIETAFRGVPGLVSWTAVSVPPVGEGAATGSRFWGPLGVNGSVFGVDATTFAVLGTDVLYGRGFGDYDVRSAVPVAVVNVRGAAALWPQQSSASAIGRQILIDRLPHTVVGVVEDIRPRPGVAGQAALYLPLSSEAAPHFGWTMQLPVLLRMAEGQIPDPEDLRRRFLDQVPTGMVGAPRSVSAEAAPWLDQPRFQAALFGSLAAIALLLAGVGLYAVSAFEAAARRHETGVRLAMGATRADIQRGVIGGALRPVLGGAAAGLVLTWWAAQYLQSLLFEVDARDPWTYVAVALMLAATAVAAAWVPARRAARTDPAATLRPT